MNQNNSSVGGNHKYLQISINTDNARDVLLFLCNETKRHRQEIDTITKKIEQILKSNKHSQLGQNFDDFCTETNRKFEDFNMTFNSLLRNFTNHQESIKSQIEKSSNDIQKEITNKIIDIQNKIYPFSGLLSRANELQILCDQLCSDKSNFERIKKIKNMENDIDQLQKRIKKLEELQKEPSKELLNTEIDESCSEKSSSDLDISENQINNDDISEKNEKIQKIDDNNNENQNHNKSTENNNNNNNVVNKLDLNSSKNDSPSKKKNQAPNFYSENALLQSNKEKANLNTKNDNNKASAFNYKLDSTEKHQKRDISNENEKSESKKNSQKIESLQTKADVKQSKDLSTKNDDIFNRMNRKNKKEKINTIGTPALNPKPNKNQPNVNSKASSLQNDSLKEKQRKYSTASASSTTKNYIHHQTDFQKNKDNKKEEEYENDNENENENIANELRSLKDLLSLQSKQLSLLMEPDSLLISTIAKIVSEMIEKRKNEIDDNNEAKLQRFCGEMKRNIDSMRSQVETANEKLNKCATKSELINVADDILNSNINDSQNTAIGATSMCHCLACGKPSSSVSTLSRMSKINSPLFIDRNLYAILKYKNLSETTTNLYQSQNSNPGARVKLLIPEKKSPF